MKHKIDYNFNLCKTACNNLEDIAQDLKTEIINTKNNNLDILSRSWQCEGAEVFLNKYIGLIEDIKKIREDIIFQSEHILKTSHKLYILEQESQDLIKTKGS